MEDRTAFRNVNFYSATSPNAVLGGLVQNGSITRKNALRMLDIILISNGPIQVTSESTGAVLEADDSPLEIGDYLISSESKSVGRDFPFPIDCRTEANQLGETGEIDLSNEVWVQRIISSNISCREDQFRDGVRARDGHCVFSSIVNLRAPRRWTSFETAHVFPLEAESHWTQKDYGRWVSDMDDAFGVSKINSVQNGLLVRTDIHKLFDQYLISIDPDVSPTLQAKSILLAHQLTGLQDGYKIVVFDVDLDGLDGRILDPVCRDPDDPHRVSDHILRWHFRQSVLANVRCAGEPLFEDDFPPGTDIMGEIEKGPLPKERFELELSSRLKKRLG